MTDTLILYDGYGDSGAFEDLVGELNASGISFDVIPNFEGFQNWKHSLENPDRPVLFYRNEFMRIQNPRSVLDHHRQNPDFPFTTDISWGFHQPISFTPSKVKLLDGFKLYSENLWSFIYNPSNHFMGVAKPKYEQVPIFVLAHNRPEYLTLTLNSLLYSTQDQANRKIIVVLNDASSEVKNLCLSYLIKDPTIEFLEIEPNAKFAALNIAVQVYKPNKFIYCEDDVIFPETTRNYFPQWVTQFASRLKDFDIVAWHYGIENVNIIYGLQRLNLPDHSRWLKVEEHYGLTIGGQCFCTSYDYYSRCASPENNWTPVDKVLFEGKGYSPSLRLYHLGFNHRMDYPKRIIDSETFKVKSDRYTARKLLTGETFSIALKDIKK